MRPYFTGEQEERDESGRIIYLGDVRRRRRKGVHSRDRFYLIALALTALVTGGIWLSVAYTLPPRRLLTYIAFFTPFSLAVASTLALAAYAIDSRRGLTPQIGVAIRRGGLGAAFLVVNLCFLAAHQWVILVGGVTLVATLLSDLVLGRSRKAA